MKSAVVWIFGRGGLLGSRLTAAITKWMPSATCWKCAVPQFSWSERTVLAQQLEQAVSQFARVARGTERAWIIVWAAGAGVIGTSDGSLQAETDAWQQLLSLLDRHLYRSDCDSRGCLFIASSAGGVYGGCRDELITEATVCQPISAYGRNKLRQERLLQEWAETRSDVDYLIGRISNLYGPGQDLTKPQGLISHISRSIIWQHPVQIYVPLDTIRDYLYVDDCAEQIACCLGQRLHALDGRAPFRRGHVKILAAEQATSVAQLIGTFSRLAACRHPRIICAPNRLATLQPRRLQFRSIAAPDLRQCERTPLLIGINQVHQHQLALYHRGRLAPA